MCVYVYVCKMMFFSDLVPYKTEHCSLSHHDRFVAQVVAKDIVPDEQEAIKVGTRGVVAVVTVFIFLVSVNGRHSVCQYRSWCVNSAIL